VHFINQNAEKIEFNNIHELMTKINIVDGRALGYEAYRLVAQGGLKIPTDVPLIKTTIYGEPRYLALRQIGRTSALTICNWERDPTELLATLIDLKVNRAIAEVEYLIPKAKEGFINHAYSAVYRPKLGWTITNPGN
jgi:hypothetical protein